MPNSRLYREKSRKKTRYSSDSDSERERSRKYREKSSSKTKDRRSRESSRKASSSRRKRYSSSSSSSSGSSRSSSRSSRSSSSSDRDRKSSSKPSRSSSSKKAEKKTFDHVKTFEINDLYKEEDKVKVLDSIESDTFKQETFQSKSKIVVDLKKDKIEAPESLAADGQEDEALIHPNFLGDEEAKVDKWIKKLHLYRSQ